MDTKKRKLIVYIVFVLAAIYGFYNLKDNFDKKSTELAPAIQKETIPQTTAIPPNSINIEQYSKLDWGRDPFFKAKGSDPIISNSDNNQTGWILNGILYDKKSPTAVINKKIVKLGDKINGAKIIKITKTKVVLKDDNSDIFSLHINKDKS